jgi:hypothetical protein
MAHTFIGAGYGVWRVQQSALRRRSMCSVEEEVEHVQPLPSESLLTTHPDF